MSADSTATVVTEAIDQVLTHGARKCTDPSCARHVGTTDCPPISISRSPGSVLGEAVAEAWHSAGGSRLDIPAGVVAALALWPQKSPGAEAADTIAAYIAAQPPRVLVRGLADSANFYWGLRPDLWTAARPLFDWTREDLHDTHLAGVRAVARAALRHGVLQHTGDTDPAERSRTDLMSWVITSLRHHHSRRSLGEYHTPPDISDLMANVLAEGSIGKRPRQRGEWALEPAAGTGGLFRSAAQDLRRDGEDPAERGWVMLELDPLAAAGAAVNTLVWELGPRAFVGCGDVLAQPDLAEETLAQARGMARHCDDVKKLIGFAIATRTTNQLLDALTASR
ncbi:N-6 DNA methylase (plasmid) [Streptomyces sp. BB1-1-1]|uniref:N-6 DNA methylase n=1 Tax=Streptomyces sp. BB1-1-1 TaxID=3074430 RepID=UPI0028778485|nr:N-6 DNA methylase [Streptomyces sp. BB1-1-1]WND40641.1 N-6 DNA methylase [Streptomyces sp. BB1-1-1]